MLESIPKSKIFRLIYKLSGRIKIKLLCNLIGVSMSGYYKHRKLILTNKTKENKEKYDLILIKNLALKSNRKYGYKTITMKLAEKGIIMNHKKVLRLMNKYDILFNNQKKRSVL